MLLRNGSFFTKTALDSEYESSYIQLDERRWYSVSSMIRVQEIEDYGQPGQHKLPPDEGHGYIWRMCSLSQLEERDGGVYVDEELMALSRDMPAALQVGWRGRLSAGWQERRWRRRLSEPGLRWGAT